ncbi:MAG: sulfatase-like hydrolase/transferase [Bacteroidales bacterium]|nr:sulfatase-like hydrolase/transferase [Bacteroidales bacterium]
MKDSKYIFGPRIKFVIFYILFWILFFFALKVLFLVSFCKKTLTFDFKSVAGVFYHGFKLDFSVTGYLLIIPLITLFVTSFFYGRFGHLVIKTYTFFLLIISPLLIITDLVLYKFWGFRLDNTPLLYIKNPDEMVASVSTGYILLGLFFSAALSYLLIRIFKHTVLRRIEIFKKGNFTERIILLLLLPALIIPIRGGFSTSPVNLSSAYFHADNFLNHAAVNLFWNLGYSFTNKETQNNPYNFFPEEDAGMILDSLVVKRASEETVLTVKRPNILLIILESFTSKVIEPLGGIPGITPGFNKICNSGILFRNFYANGDRSDKGIVALFSGFPALGNTSIMKFPDKAGKLPAFPRDLKHAGYHLSFYYGGDIEFFNLKSYLISIGFHDIISDKDFKTEKKLSKWGAPDEFVFNRLYNDLINKKDTPFFKALFTLSNHDPFDIPVKPKFGKDNDDNKFFSGANYTDSCLFDFIQKFSKSTHWNNTLIVIVADHGSRMPGNTAPESAENYWIPMLWTGGAVNKDTVVSKISMQTDLPATLLEQLNITGSPYKFSNNIFAAEHKGYACYSFNEGFGFLTDTVKYFYNSNAERLHLLGDGQTDQAVKSGKALFQTAYDDFLKY